ncbi:MAG: glutamine--fructose-6-phosphate transaminase (isomerizing) [Vallitaleaceae bacterium]|nr:glutamine--fructose-6-phosphate transaminase (isomerizing) [Vallitaleaceae bacterium]
MCGIVGYIGEKEAAPILVEGLKALEYRGYDSAGVAIMNDKIKIVKTKGRIKELEECLVEDIAHGSVGIGHTRWATHGEPSYLNAHPHINKGVDIAVVHNGIIENYLELRDELGALGYEFVSETDTETIVHLIEECQKTNETFLDAVLCATKKLHGSYAIAVVRNSDVNEIITVRKDSPLVIGLGEGENYIASDIPALLKHTRKVYFLEDGEVAILHKDGVQLLDMDKNPVSKEIFEVTWDIDAAEKSGYDHFMLKEIYEQPRVIKDTLASRLAPEYSEIKLDQLRISKELLEQINKIYIVACGTAYYAGYVGKELIEKVARIPVVSEVASEFRYKDPILDKNTLMIVVSQSGETADTLAALRMAKEAGAYVIGIVNVVGSTIAREAHDVLYTAAGPEIAVASTKAYTAQLIAMYLICIKIGRILGKISDELFSELKVAISELPKQVDLILNHADQIEALAKKHLDMKNIFYIGRGLDHAASMEGALKIKEVAYLHAESYPAGELKHGPIALIESGSVLMGLIGQEDLMDKTVSNIKEVKSRGANVIAIALEGNRFVEKIADDVIYVPRTHWMFSTLLVNIPQQLFAYYMACGLGHDVDKPRNLAKSVTVE